MRVNVFIAIGVVFAVIGLLGVTYIFPKMMCISGQDFNEKLTKDANGIETFEGYDDGDSFTMVDAISRIQYEFDEAGKTSVWLESIGKSNSDSRFLVSQNIMEDYGVGSEVVLTFEVSTNSDNSQILVNDEISSRYSTTNEYIFMILILGGVGSICYGGYTAFIGKDEEPQDDWGFPAQAPTQPPVAAPPMAAAPVAPPMGGPPAAIPPMVAPPAAVPPVSSNEPTSMTITVPPGVVPGQVLTVGLPDGRTVNVQVPAGCNAGSQFTITVN